MPKEPLIAENGDPLFEVEITSTVLWTKAEIEEYIENRGEDDPMQASAVKAALDSSMGMGGAGGEGVDYAVTIKPAEYDDDED